MLLSYLNERMQNSVRVSNFDVARDMEFAKLELIAQLAKCPVTVPWLVSKYGNATLSDGANKQTVLENLKKLNLKVQQSLSKNDWQFVEQTQEMQEFVEVLQTFPFVFSDLIELTDVVIYTFWHTGLDEATVKSYTLTPKQTRRLKNLSRLQAGNIAKQLLALGIAVKDLPCTFAWVLACVAAEQTWLSLRQQLVERNTRLVSFIANQYKSEFLDFDDLLQEGQTGLLIAADRFNHQFGCQFSTYAAYWIKQRISRALAKHERVVRVPYEQLSSFSKLFRAKEELLAKTGTEPSIKELAEHLNLSEIEISTLLFVSQTALPLENFSDDEDESFAPIDVLEQEVYQTPFKQMAKAELDTWLTIAMQTLNDREKKVLYEHFGLNSEEEMTLQEIGSTLNISRERVRQIQAMAFNKMKLNYGEQLFSFL